jgi:hypothetical protein
MKCGTWGFRIYHQQSGERVVRYVWRRGGCSMKMFVWSIFFLLPAMVVGCSNKEQAYEGLYKGLSAAEENRQIDNRSYDPVKSLEHEQPTYREYKWEREESVGKNNPRNIKIN